MIIRKMKELIAVGDSTRRLMKELLIQPRSLEEKEFQPQVTNRNNDYGYSPNLIKTGSDLTKSPITYLSMQ